MYAPTVGCQKYSNKLRISLRSRYSTTNSTIRKSLTFCLKKIYSNNISQFLITHQILRDPYAVKIKQGNLKNNNSKNKLKVVVISTTKLNLSKSLV